jgi:mannose-6-phosphate isomerase-like protein (cupin superfamily)
MINTPDMKLQWIFLFATTYLFCGAAQASDFPDIDWQKVVWTPAELALPIATQHLARSPEQSSHLIRLMGRETPHYHDSHDLSIKVLAGESVVHLADKNVRLTVGDELVVPRGILHWAENTQSEANIVLVLFNPGFDGKDKREAH